MSITFTMKDSIAGSMSGSPRKSEYFVILDEGSLFLISIGFSRILSTQVNINETHFSKGEKVSSLDLLLEQSDRKITRNQKRKHDEINHVQKVGLLLW